MFLWLISCVWIVLFRQVLPDERMPWYLLHCGHRGHCDKSSCRIWVIDQGTKVYTQCYICKTLFNTIFKPSPLMCSFVCVCVCVCVCFSWKVGEGVARRIAIRSEYTKGKDTNKQKRWQRKKKIKRIKPYKFWNTEMLIYEFTSDLHQEKTVCVALSIF